MDGIVRKKKRTHGVYSCTYIVTLFVDLEGSHWHCGYWCSAHGTLTEPADNTVRLSGTQSSRQRHTERAKTSVVPPIIKREIWAEALNKQSKRALTTFGFHFVPSSEEKKDVCCQAIWLPTATHFSRRSFALVFSSACADSPQLFGQFSSPSWFNQNAHRFRVHSFRVHAVRFRFHFGQLFDSIHRVVGRWICLKTKFVATLVYSKTNSMILIIETHLSQREINRIRLSTAFFFFFLSSASKFWRKTLNSILSLHLSTLNERNTYIFFFCFHFITFNQSGNNDGI